MKEIGHLRSRGRLISPSLPVGDDWYLNINYGRFAFAYVLKSNHELPVDTPEFFLVSFLS